MSPAVRERLATCTEARLNELIDGVLTASSLHELGLEDAPTAEKP